MKTARVFQEPTGSWHICSDELPYLDARGLGYPTRRDAIQAARGCGYTHIVRPSGRVVKL